MSYAEDFGHDIPPDDWDGGGIRSGRNRRSSYIAPAASVIKTIDITLVHQTEKAYLIEDSYGKAWVPISQCTLSEDQKKLSIPEWLLESLNYIEVKTNNTNDWPF